MRDFLVAAVLIPAVLGAAVAGPACGGAEDRDLATVEIGSLRVLAEAPDTEEAFYRGLGGRESLPEDRGMLFVFRQESKYGFWMKDVPFPIDIIWISGDMRVAGIATAQPEPGVPDDQLTIYRPDNPALYVLEVGAGLAERYGLRLGDPVRLQVPESLVPWSPEERASGDYMYNGRRLAPQKLVVLSQ